jgi:hypothetical protein
LVSVAKENEKLEVDILEERTVSLPTAEGPTREEVWITYRYGRLPPRLVRIPKERDSPEERARVIKTDLQSALEAKRRTLKV